MVTTSIVVIAAIFATIFISKYTVGSLYAKRLAQANLKTEEDLRERNRNFTIDQIKADFS